MPRTLVLARLAVSSMTAAVSLLANAPPIGAQVVTAAQVPTGQVSGVVFDSLRMLPVPGANVWLPGTVRAALSDDRGRYEIDSVPEGLQVIAFSAPSLDSLGFGSFAAQVNVRAGANTKLQLGTASFATIWQKLCEHRPRLGSDSGIVWGRVQDASSNRLLENAPTLFNWYELKTEGKRVNLSEASTEVRSDSSGTYFACGLPTDVAITTRAYGERKVSGDVSYTIGDHYVYRVDLSVSADMYVAAGASGARTALGTSLRGRGTAVLKGFVLDDRGRGVPEALLSVSSADTAIRTARDGSYTLRDMPGGTQSVEVRSLGYAMATRLVNLRPGEINETNFALRPATELATFNVRAERAVRPDHAEFLERRKMGIGWAREIASEGYANAADVLTSIPRLVVKHSGGIPSVTMLDGGQNDCSPVFFLDGRRSDMESIMAYPVENLRAVEVYGKYTVPLRFQSPVSNGSCGTILYWSKYRW